MSWTRLAGCFALVAASLGAAAAGVGAPEDTEACVPERVPVVGLACWEADKGLYHMFGPDGQDLGFTHGPDPIPPALLGEGAGPSTAGAAINPFELLGLRYHNPGNPFCVGATEPYAAQIILARSTGPPSSMTVQGVREIVQHMNGLLRREGLEMGKPAEYRIVCENGIIDVDEVILASPPANADFDVIVTQLQALGYTDPTRKYFVWYDGSHATAGGIGHIWYDDQGNVNNMNNGNSGSPMFSLTFGYDSIGIMMHEAGHNLGAVQNSAPQTTQAGHCIDGNDVMCYADGGPKAGFYSASYCPKNFYDCNGDDYFNTNPAPSSYLGQFWNQGAEYNRFFDFTAYPEALTDAIVTPEGTPVSFTLEGYDEDAYSYSVAVLSGPTEGTLDTSALPKVTYTPTEPEWSGLDGFTFAVKVGATFSKPVTVGITVEHVNDPPTAVDQTVDMLEDTTATIALKATDADDKEHTFTPGPASPGTATGGAVVTYTPPANFAGTATVPFTVSDGVDTDTGMLTINVHPVDDGPEAPDVLLVTPEDTSVMVPVPTMDGDGDPVTASFGPTGIGTLSGSLPSVAYTPPPGFSGTVAFTYAVTGGTLTDEGLITIDVLPVNDVPVAVGATYAVVGTTPRTMLLSGSDADGDALTFALVGPPLPGLSGTPPALEYTSDGGCGVETFQFTATDPGLAVSPPATVTLDLNCPPVAFPPAPVVLDEDSGVTIPLAGSDPDGDAITFELAAAPSMGTLSLVGDAAVYVPFPDRCGADSFAVRARDHLQPGLPALATVTVTCQPDAPKAMDAAVRLRVGEERTVLLAGTDADGEALTFSLLGEPTLATRDGDPPVFVLRGAAVGQEHVRFQVTDGTLSGEGRLRIIVDPDLPATARVTYVGVVAGTRVSTMLPGGDRDTGIATYTITQAPAAGTLSGSGPEVVYEADEDYTGVDPLVFTASDGEVTREGEVRFVVIPDLACKAPKLNAVEDASLAIVPYLNLPKELGPEATIIKEPVHGELAVRGPNDWTYTPDPDFSGIDALVYQVQGVNLIGEPCVLLVDVAQRNDPPIVSLGAVPDLDQNLPEQVLPGFTAFFHPGAPHEDGQRLLETKVKVLPEGAGTATVDPAGALHLKTALDWAGELALEVDVRDSGGVQDGGQDVSRYTLRLDVRPVDDPPRPGEDAVAATEDEPAFIAVLANDYDPEGQGIRLAGVGKPRNGEAVLQGAAILYTPRADFAGEDTFEYTLSDGKLAAKGKVVVTVAPVDDASRLAADAFQTIPGQALQSPAPGVLRNDGDIDSTLEATLLQPPAHGTLELAKDGSFTYVPEAGFEGTDRFTYQAGDGQAQAVIQVATPKQQDTSGPDLEISGSAARLGIGLVAFLGLSGVAFLVLKGRRRRDY